MEDTTKKEILEAIGSLSDRLDQTNVKLDERFDSLSDRIGQMDERFDSLSDRIDQMDERFDSLSDRIDQTETGLLEAIHVFADNVDQRFQDIIARLTRVESTMVTKDYLDDKLATHHSDIVKFVRKRVPEWVRADNI